MLERYISRPKEGKLSQEITAVLVLKVALLLVLWLLFFNGGSAISSGDISSSFFKSDNAISGGARP